MKDTNSFNYLRNMDHAPYLEEFLTRYGRMAYSTLPLVK
ncbi:hypothetical protein RA210_U460010 [Rubrivivax sp. A210]|nr:hypothetical protein RA210_U460010 [Rubrivivax sp. A210]